MVGGNPTSLAPDPGDLSARPQLWGDGVASAVELASLPNVRGKITEGPSSIEATALQIYNKYSTYVVFCNMYLQYITICHCSFFDDTKHVDRFFGVSTFD